MYHKGVWRTEKSSFCRNASWKVGKKNIETIFSKIKKLLLDIGILELIAEESS